MRSRDLPDVLAIVVHHRSYGSIGRTTSALVEQGISASHVLVVDNSEEPEKRALLDSVLPPGTTVLFIDNRGYGNAVNAGLDYWDEHNKPDARTFLLVATHEALVHGDAVSHLRHALVETESAAAAGPTLITGDDEFTVWSKGGRLSRVLGIPRHYGHRDPFDQAQLTEEQPEPRRWLDGAFILYRWGPIRDLQLDESFMMYMEETELHLRLGAVGWDVLWVPSSIVWQSSGGIPAFYLSRNLRLLYTRRDRRFQGLVAVPFDVTRRALSGLRRGRPEIRQLLRGMMVRLPPPASGRHSPIVIVNPLGAALEHYVRELESVIRSADGSTSVRSFVEPSSSGESRIAWVLSYAAALREASRRSKGSNQGPMLVTWPVLGYLDLVLIRILYRRPAWLVMHDPEPLVRAVGYGSFSRTLGRIFEGRTALIVHSSVARAVVDKHAVVGSIALLPHPILPPAESHSTDSTRPVVRVLGQYKPDRDVSLLQQIGSRLAESHQLEILGRGWPDIAGWSVTEGFLSEADMTAAVLSSDVVVVPYSRFFQSGIAIRALEHGIPVVGPRESSLKDLLGEHSSFLVSSHAREQSGAPWVTAIREASSPASRAEALRASRAIRSLTVESWGTWITMLSKQGCRGGAND